MWNEGVPCTDHRRASPRSRLHEFYEDEASGLRLRFSCYLGRRGKEPNGPEEQADQIQFDSDNGYKAALLSTLKRTRELFVENKL